MKKTATCCIIALSLAACQKSTVNPASERSPAAVGPKNLASVTSAAPFHTQDDLDISSLGLQVSTCTGEPLQVVSGDYQ
ncbi:MAG TPA: hypothetical protein VHS53_01280 [Mucilaginibacter sp.]|nr:hypothetical protein [Mucilaginibacter sp.]